MVYRLALCPQCQAKDGNAATTQYSFTCDTRKVIIIYFVYNYNSLRFEPRHAFYHCYAPAWQKFLPGQVFLL